MPIPPVASGAEIYLVKTTNISYRELDRYCNVLKFNNLLICSICNLLYFTNLPEIRKHEKKINLFQVHIYFI